MGCVNSKKIYTHQDEDENDPMVLELKEHFAQFDKEGRGEVQLGDVAALYRCCAEQELGPADAERARRQLDLAGRGYVTWADFYKWFLNGEDKVYVEQAVKKEPEVHPSVLAGLKDEGVAEGTAQYDREEEARRARAELAELLGPAPQNPPVPRGEKEKEKEANNNSTAVPPAVVEEGKAKHHAEGGGGEEEMVGTAATKDTEGPEGQKIAGDTAEEPLAGGRAHNSEAPAEELARLKGGSGVGCYCGNNDCYTMMHSSSGFVKGSCSDEKGGGNSNVEDSLHVWYSCPSSSSSKQQKQQQLLLLTQYHNHSHQNATVLHCCTFFCSSSCSSRRRRRRRSRSKKHNNDDDDSDNSHS